jgi:hypothetical protein
LRAKLDFRWYLADDEEVEPETEEIAKGTVVPK